MTYLRSILISTFFLLPLLKVHAQVNVYSTRAGSGMYAPFCVHNPIDVISSKWDHTSYCLAKGGLYLNDQSDLSLLKFDSAGTYLWVQHYPSKHYHIGDTINYVKWDIYYNYMHSIKSVESTNLILAGASWVMKDTYVNSFLQSSEKFFVPSIIKADSSGQVIWFRNFDFKLPSTNFGNYGGYHTSVSIDALNHNYYLSIFFQNVDSSGVLILKTDTVGNVSWSRTVMNTTPLIYGSSEFNQATGMLHILINDSAGTIISSIDSTGVFQSANKLTVSGKSISCKSFYNKTNGNVVLGGNIYAQNDSSTLLLEVTASGIFSYAYQHPALKNENTLKIIPYDNNRIAIFSQCAINSTFGRIVILLDNTQVLKSIVRYFNGGSSGMGQGVIHYSSGPVELNFDMDGFQILSYEYSSLIFSSLSSYSIVLVKSTKDLITCINFQDPGPGYLLDSSHIVIQSTYNFDQFIVNNITGPFSFDTVLVRQQCPLYFQYNCTNLVNVPETRADVEEIRVFPNPFEDELVIEFPKYPLSGRVEATIYDITGRLIFQLKNLGLTGNKITLSNLHMIPGAYLLKVIDVNTVFQSRIIKK